MTIDTPRTRLRPWRESDRAAFAALMADAEVMADLGGPIGRTAADAKLDRYIATYRDHGIGRLAVETRDGALLGYVGVMPVPAGHPLAPGYEIGWRMARTAWGKGYATEAATAALSDAFSRPGIAEIVAFTAADNRRSQAVMTRLGMRRDPVRDFSVCYDGVTDWHGLVWVALPG